MQLIDELRRDIRAAKKVRPLPWWAVLLGIVGCTFVVALFDHFGREYLYLPTLNCIAVLGFLLVLKRKLWRHAWFWVTMIVIAAHHVALILSIPWGDKWVPAVAIGVIDSLDFVVVLAVIDFLGELTGGKETAS